ncbi:MAG TPA: SpoIIE family protein phosphatase [Thermoanaerobaculia bacterium]|nr:SpoIIE family protein phosphatase [Thermoanaerobaculia bacterium]
MLRLHVVPAQGAPFEHRFDGDTLVVGRSSSSDLPLADRFLSRHHARIFRDGEHYLVEDLGSRNGTLLNGQPVLQPTLVAAGDVIRISGSTLSVQRDEDEPLDEIESGHTVFRPVAELLAQEASRAGAGDRPALERYAERLRLLNEVHQALGSALGLPELLQLILDRLFDHLQPEQAAIYLRDAHGAMSPVASRSREGKGNGEPRLVASQRLTQEVTEKGVAALVLDAQSDARFRGSESLLAAGIRSLVAAPLLAEGGPAVGMVLLTTNAAVRQFGEEDMQLLVSLAAVAAIRLRNVALQEEAAQRRVLEEELALARRIQQALIPAQLPALAGFELCARNVPSRHVSGDLYQTALRKDGAECVLLLADVAGKGMAASLLAASVEALSAAPIEDGQPPAEICARVSRLLFQRTPGEKYATAFLAVLDGRSGRVEYANAGHNPALVVRAGGEVETLGATGLPLGLLPGMPYRSAAVQLLPGDTLVLYTDGFTEAANEDDEELGLERLIVVCREHRADAPAALADAIDAAVAAFVGTRPPGDDRTLLLARRSSE